MIDGAGRNIGQVVNGITIEGIEVLAQYKEDKSVLVVIYPNIENEIQLQISKFLPKADTIVARLLDIEERESTYASNREDIIILDYMLTLHADISYMDVGVCHPVVRNNTYLFYERGFTNGVLAEHLLERYEVDVLTSCARDYMPWDNYYPEKVSGLNGVTVHRFPVEKTKNESQVRELSARVNQGSGMDRPETDC
ncbi:MAG: hypothetical protein K2I96_15650 [Lachnospiraceae bacterium]|nr:hypothetical protein [Lachnospiraceae bacterium]